MHLPPLHLVVMQPEGYVHSLGFLDQARYFRHQFRRLGATVTLAKNRLREDALNFVFGAHLGLPTEALERHRCVFVNLEQLGRGGAPVAPEYLELLRRGPSVDYDPANAAVYAAEPGQVPCVSFLHAPYLADPATPPLPLEQRPIDLLFFGSTNARRQAYFARVESTGVKVSCFDQPLYGDERDHYIRQSKAVLNCHYYETSRFEQARAFHSLSLGTPVISERLAATQAPAAYDDAVFWLGEGSVETFFAQQFGRPAFYDGARARLAAFRQRDALPEYAALLRHALARAGEPGPRTAWQPRTLRLGDGAHYRPGWLNLSAFEHDAPDLLLDLGQPLALPLQCRTRQGAALHLAAGSLDRLQTTRLPALAHELPTLLDNALALLKTGGECAFELRLDATETASANAVLPGHPTHALDEAGWRACVAGHAAHRWLEHRFEIDTLQWLSAQRQPCARPEAVWLRLGLRKVVTSPQERTRLRVLRADFGGLPDDALPPPAAGQPQPQAASAAEAI
jgi:hypothetical protein